MHIQRRHENADLDRVLFDVFFLPERGNCHHFAVSGGDDQVVSLRGSSVRIPEEIESEEEKKNQNPDNTEPDDSDVDKERGERRAED